MKKRKARKTAAKDVKPPAPSPVEKDSQQDFGGLPSRDLKKNLGCG